MKKVNTIKKTQSIIITILKIIHVAMAMTFFSWVLYNMIINVI